MYIQHIPDPKEEQCRTHIQYQERLRLVRGIWIVQEHRLSVPRVLCDVCGEQITGRTGIIVYDAGLEVAEPWFVHRGTCDHQFEARFGWKPWLALDRGIVRMIHDSDVDLMAASKSDALVRSVG